MNTPLQSALRPKQLLILALPGIMQGASLHSASYWGGDYFLKLPLWAVAALVMVCLGGLLVQLMRGEQLPRRRWGWVLVWVGAWALAAVWIFHQVALTVEYPRPDTYRLLIFWLLATVATLLVAPFIQAGRISIGADYPRLLAYLLNNVTAVGIALVMLILLTLLTGLSAGLFFMLEIRAPLDWIQADWFTYLVYVPFFTTVLALPLQRTWWQAELPALLWLASFAAFVVLAFTATLAVVGLTPLWERKIAAPLLLTLTTFMLLFVNCIWRDGTLTPPAKWLQAIFAAALLVLPVLALLALWGWWLRYQQYGLTPLRLWGLVSTLMIITAALAYASCAAYRRRDWLAGLRWVNPPLFLLLAGLMLLLHTPLLDVQRLTANNQYQRAIDPQIPLKQIDVKIFYDLGDYGRQRLTQLEAWAAAKPDDTRAASIQKDLQSLAATAAQQHPKAVSGWEAATAHGIPVAEARQIVTTIRKQHENIAFNFSCELPARCALLAINLDEDEQVEYCMVQSFYEYSHLDCFARDNDQYVHLGRLLRRDRNEIGFRLWDALQTENWQTAPAPVRDVIIDGEAFFLLPVK